MMSSTMIISGPQAAPTRPKVAPGKFKHLVKIRLPVTGKSVHTKAKPKPGAHKPEANRAKKLGHPLAPDLLPAPPPETPHHPLRSLKLGNPSYLGQAKSAVRLKLSPVRTGKLAGDRKAFALRIGRQAIRIHQKQVVSGKAKGPAAIKEKPEAALKATMMGTKPPVKLKATRLRVSPGGGHRPPLKVRGTSSDVVRSGTSTVKPRVTLGKTAHPVPRAGARAPQAPKSFGLTAGTPGTLAPPAASHRTSTGGESHQAKVETPAPAPGWKIQAGPMVQQDGVKHSSWIIRPPVSAGQPMKLELTQEGSKLKADLTVSASQIATGLVNASPTALPHHAVHLPDGVSTLEFSLFSQGGNQAFSGDPGHSGGTVPYVPELGRHFRSPEVPTGASYGEGSAFTSGIDYRV